ncbi:MAG: hypothetical protein JO281_05850 [Pseudonocardiales bacterium]|nr:hypothetical protein [Pseudonocardiales bacterium]
MTRTGQCLTCWAGLTPGASPFPQVAPSDEDLDQVVADAVDLLGVRPVRRQVVPVKGG